MGASNVKLPVALGCGIYDRTLPLQDGTVPVDGVDLNFIPLYPNELFRRQARFAEFDAAEFSLASHAILRSRGDERHVGLPVFPSRMFRHSAIYVREGSAITSPDQLRGRRVGIQDYAQTASIWCRAILEHDYHVSAGDIEWVVGSFDSPSAQPRLAIDIPTGVPNHAVPPGKTLIDMVRAADIDGLIASRLPRDVLADGVVKRLFPNYRDVEQQYFERTSIFPIMHVVVMKRELYERARWLAVSLTEGFFEAKAVGLARIAWNSAVFCALPWFLHHIDETRRVVGDDPFKYGYIQNRPTLETFLGYLHEQGLLARPVTAEELFAPETLNLVDGS